MILVGEAERTLDYPLRNDPYAGRVAPVQPVSSSGDSLSQEHNRHQRQPHAPHPVLFAELYGLRGVSPPSSLGSVVDVVA